MKKDDLRQKIQLKKVTERRGVSPDSDEMVITDHILTENPSDLIRYSDSEFDNKRLPDRLQNVKSTGLTLLKKKYHRESFHPDLDESKEVEASRLAEQLHEKGYLARQSGDLEKAVQFYTQALDLCPDFQTVGCLHQCLFNRGFAYDKLGMLDEAIADYSQVIKANINNCFAYYNRYWPFTQGHQFRSQRAVQRSHQGFLKGDRPGLAESRLCSQSRAVLSERWPDCRGHPRFRCHSRSG